MWRPILAQIDIPILNDFINLVTNILNGIINALYSFGQWVVDGFLWIINGISDIIEFAVAVIRIILQFFGDLIILVVNTGIGIVGGLWAGLVGFIETLIPFIIAVVENIIKFIEILGMVIQVVVSVIQLVADYLRQLVELILNMISATSAAAPAQVAGLPQCITAPTDSGWCAIWYITDWTLLTGTFGQMIVPIIVLMIDIFIIVYIVRAMMKLIRWFQSLYTVS